MGLSKRKPEPFLRAGDWVEVRSAEEILGTLDGRGRLDNLPFMPEMLQFCGKRFRVYKSAHKTCDTIATSKSCWMAGAVHLEGLRCSGAAHGGCQAQCLLFWKKAWLKPVRDAQAPDAGGTAPAVTAMPPLLAEGAIVAAGSDADGPVYSCQATCLPEATAPISWWSPRQYVWDLATRNVGVGTFVRSVALAARNMLVRWRRRDPCYPQVPGLANGPVPMERLDLQPGEVAQIRPRDEIMSTIARNRKHKGLWFDVEMEAFCGGVYPVRSRVERIIDERTGRMLRIAGDCLILDGVACGGCRSKDRLFCPRSIYPYWREGWLKRVSPRTATGGDGCRPDKGRAAAGEPAATGQDRMQPA